MKVSLSVDDENLKVEPFLAPNPAIDFLNSSYSGSVKVYDATGKLMLAKTVHKQEPVAISILPDGLCFASLQAENSLYCQRLILAK